MEKIINVEGGQVTISEPFFSSRLLKQVREFNFVLEGNEGWGVSKSFPVDGNTFDSDFISEFVEFSKGLL